MVLAPDEIVDHVLENVAYNGNVGASLEDLWTYAGQKIPSVDEFWKNAIWIWLLNEKDKIVIGVNGQVLDNGHKSLDQITSEFDQDSIRIYATEDIQWLKLTGKSKSDSDNPLGQYPFDLLCAISRARGRGLTNVEAAKQTGQDPRSLHGRVQLLVQLGLVIKEPVVRNSVRTSLVTCTKFLNSKQRSNDQAVAAAPQLESGEWVGTYNKLNLSRAILASLKAGHEGLRAHNDLRTELGYSETRKGQIAFNRIVKQLEVKGYVQRVVLHVKDNTDFKLRCIKFVRDLPVDTTHVGDSSDEEDSVSDIDDMEGAVNTKGTSSKTKSENVETTNPQETVELDLVSKLNAGGLVQGEAYQEVLEDPSKSPSHLIPLFNVVYPVENQVYDVIHTTNTVGISAMELCTRLLGTTYTKVFTRVMELLTEIKDKRKQKSSRANLGHLTIVKGIDCSSRIKFYRYFSQSSYCTYSRVSPDAVWGEFIDLTAKKSLVVPGSGKLKILDSKTHSLPGVAEVHEVSGRLVPVFHGDKGQHQGSVSTTIPCKPAPQTSTTGRRRGRPRKNSGDLKHPRVKPKVKTGDGTGRGRKKKKLDNEEISMEDQSLAESAFEQPRIPQDGTTESSPAFGASRVIQMEVDELSVDPNIVKEPQQYNLISIKEPEAPVTLAHEADTLLSASENQAPEISQENHDETISPIKSQAQPHRPISFALVKRENQLLDLLQRHNGVLEGGQGIANLYSKEIGEPIDRKTVEKVTKSLLAQKKIDRIYVTVPGGGIRGIDITRHIIIDRAKDPNSSEVESLKRTIAEGVRRGAFSGPSFRGMNAIELDDIGVVSVSAAKRHQAMEAKKAMDAKKQRRVSKKRRIKQEDDDEVIVKTEPSALGRRAKKISEKRKDSADKASRLKKEPGPSGTENDIIARRGRRKDRMPFSVDPDSFYRVITIVRSFYGRNVIDWQMVVSQFPDLTVHRAKAYWARIRTSSGGEKLVNRAIDRWEAVFEMGYMNGELPLVEGEENYNIALYLQYWKQIDQHPIASTSQMSRAGGELREEQDDDDYIKFTSTEEIKEEYDILCIDEPFNHAMALEPFWHQPSMVKKEELLVNSPYGCYKSGRVTSERLDNDDGLILAKTTIKSIVATDESKYDSEKAKALLESFGEGIIERSVSQLERERVLVFVPRDKEKVMPGRNFAFSDRFVGELAVKLGSDVLAEAQGFDSLLLHAIRNNESGLLMYRDASDFFMISILELIASQSMYLLRANELPSSFMKGYICRSIGRDALDCDIVFRGLPSVDYKAIENQTRPAPTVPGLTITNEVPTPKFWWIGIDGQPTELWQRLITRILMHIVSRGNITLDTLSAKLATVVSYTELQTIMGWLCAKHLVQKNDCGYMVLPRWYSIDN